LVELVGNHSLPLLESVVELLSSRGRFVDGFDGSDIIYTEVRSFRSCLKSLDVEGGDDQT
jgi:hypothetical protein